MNLDFTALFRWKKRVAPVLEPVAAGQEASRGPLVLSSIGSRTDATLRGEKEQIRHPIALSAARDRESHG
jgi:hypothetical protein